MNKPCAFASESEGGVWGRAEAPYKTDSDAAMSASNAGLGAIHLVRPHRGGREGVQNWLFCRTSSTDRLHEMWTRGREKVQNPKTFADVLNGWPLRSLVSSQNTALSRIALCIL